MKPHARAFALGAALAVLTAGAPARAVVDNCTSSADGTRCVAPCIVAGSCHGGACVADLLPGGGHAWAHDGDKCSSGDRCTVDDQCQAGACIAGEAMVCLGSDKCHQAVCEPSFGCIRLELCGGDAGPTPPAPVTVPSWLGVSAWDGGNVPFTPDGGAADLTPAPNTTGDPAGTVEIPPRVTNADVVSQVRGGSLARGCSVGGAATDSPGAGLFLLLIVALYLASKLRTSRTSPTK